MAKTSKKTPKKTSGTSAKKKAAASSSGFKKTLSKWLAGIIFLGFLLVAIIGGLFWNTVLTPTMLTTKDRIINVKKGQTYYQLINEWQGKGYIKHAPIAKLYTKFFIHEPLQTGAYQLKAGDNIATVLQKIAGGEQAQMVRIQIIEGKRTQDLLALLKTTKGVSQDIAGLSAKKIQQQLKITEPHLEGVFAPNTYFFGQNTSDKDILAHLYKKQQHILQTQWKNRAKNLPYKNAYDALIMASIIEKETGVASERSMVSAVFVNRLRKGMKLQTDPTVIYGMGERYDGNIRKKDLQEKTAYNTYHISGLPPTPIALPSEASIHAALHPANSDALFFVATGTGGHTFTKTYAQHKKAVKQYLNVLREQK